MQRRDVVLCACGEPVGGRTAGKQKCDECHHKERLAYQRRLREQKRRNSSACVVNRSES